MHCLMDHLLFHKMLLPADLGSPTEEFSIQNASTHPVNVDIYVDADVDVPTWDDHQFDDSLEWPYSCEKSRSLH